MSLQLQWSIDRTVNGAMTLAAGALLAATTDNVQVLAIIACEKFGNTLAVSQDTLRKIEKAVVPVPKPALLGFLEAAVGYSSGDCVAQLGRSAAGVRFLALAASLVTTMGAFKGGQAIQTMIESTAADKTMVPTERHVTTLLERIEPRCHKSGFADEVAGWQILLSRMQHDPFLAQVSDGKTWCFPQTKGIENLVEAFRQLHRVGDAAVSKVTIRTVYCAPWTAAFTKWCLGYPPSILFEDGSPILEQHDSNVNIMIPKQGDSGLFEVTIYSSVDGPSQLVGPRMDKSYVGMIGVKTYGMLLRQYYHFEGDEKERAIHQCLPYAIGLAARNVLPSDTGVSVLSTLPFASSSSQALNSIEPLAHDYRLSPFPEERTISKAESVLFGHNEKPRMPTLEDGLLLSDLPLVKNYLLELKKNCHCTVCSSNPESVSQCETTVFFIHLSILVADILALSLFDRLEDLLVSNTVHRPERSNGHEFVNAIHIAITRECRSKCSVNSIVDWALRIVGHSVNHGKSWILSSHMGQAVWPSIYETKLYEKHGFLRLSWLPGLLLFKGESYKACTGPLFNTIGSDPITDICKDSVTQPCNLCPHLELKWNMTSNEAGGLEASLSLKDVGKTTAAGVLNPSRIIQNLATALFVGPCSHDSNSRLPAADRFCVFTGPFKPAGDIDNIWVVAVDGSDELRFFALANNMGNYPVVLRRGACLACCLAVCWRVSKGGAALVL
ncbi:hypothetical protein BX600DRAFT_387419 [Xylariales sp. PMI_506]|nr:hypothetical protein BX600DRAFT_387419 [Xylariales sp. PMI_506]